MVSLLYGRDNRKSTGGPKTHTSLSHTCTFFYTYFKEKKVLISHLFIYLDVLFLIFLFICCILFILSFYILPFYF